MAGIPIAQALDLAAGHRQAGRLAEAEQIYRQILSADPNCAAAFHQLGMIAAAVNRHDVAIELIGRAAQLKPSDLAVHNDLANEFQRSGRYEDAILSYRRALTLNGECAEVYYNLGDAYCAAGQLNEAIASFRRALSLAPQDAQIHNHLGIALQENGELPEATARFERAVALNPAYAGAHNNLGAALAARGQLDQAIAAYQRSLEFNPSNPQAHNNFALAKQAKGDLAGAIASFQRAVELDPAYSIAWSNQGVALAAAGRLDDAIAAYQRSLALNLQNPQTISNLGNALKDGGRLDGAIDAYESALKLKPDYREAHSNLLHAMYLHPKFEPVEILDAHREWERRHLASIGHSPRKNENDRSPDRKLRIGHVSSDFRNHVAPRFLLGPFANIDRDHFEVVCFSGVEAEDVVTKRLRACADEWHPTVGLSDEELAELIRKSRIDILLDLSLHLAGTRLGVFARKPAPVQITALAYPGTSGIAAMDYRFTDGFLDPPGETETYYSEQSIRLKTYWCYQPWEIKVSEPEPRAAGPLTFGCLNNFAKVSDPALTTWAELLREVPEAKLLLYAPPGNHRQRVNDVMNAAGVDMARVEFAEPVPLKAYLESYRRIDIALDPFPCSGGTTTCDAMWMGVPVITLAGKIAMGRAGVSMLNQIGLPDLIASDRQQYVRIAADLARDTERLADLRRSLRQRMIESPLCDAMSFIRDVEKQYRWMWHRWCASA